MVAFIAHREVLAWTGLGGPIWLTRVRAIDFSWSGTPNGLTGVGGLDIGKGTPSLLCACWRCSLMLRCVRELLLMMLEQVGARWVYHGLGDGGWGPAVGRDRGCAWAPSLWDGWRLHRECGRLTRVCAALPMHVR